MSTESEGMGNAAKLGVLAGTLGLTGLVAYSLREGGWLAKKTASGPKPAAHPAHMAAHPAHMAAHSLTENAVLVLAKPQRDPQGSLVYAQTGHAGPSPAHPGAPRSFTVMESAAYLTVHGKKTSGLGQAPEGLEPGHVYTLGKAPGFEVGTDLGTHFAIKHRAHHPHHPLHHASGPGATWTYTIQSGSGPNRANDKMETVAANISAADVSRKDAEITAYARSLPVEKINVTRFPSDEPLMHITVFDTMFGTAPGSGAYG